MLAVQAGDQLKDRFSSAAVEIAGRLIGQQDLRLGDERPGQGQPLLLASGKLARTMMPARFQSYFAQPAGRFLFRSGERLPARQQGHGYVLQRSELGQQVVKLPDVSDFAVTKLGGIIFRKRIHLRVCAVYGTGGRTIKSRQDVQQSTLSRTRLPHDRQHRAFVDLERQILKEHEFGFA